MSEYRVIDADGHFAEPSSVWPEHLPRKFHASAPRYAQDTQGRWRMVIGGTMKAAIPMPGDAAPGDDTMGRGGYDPKTRLEDMDREGIDVMVMYPTTGLYFYGIEDLELTVALCRAYNDWAHGFCQNAPKRLIAPAVLPQMDVEACLREVDRCARDLGCGGVMLRPNPVAGRTLDHPAFDPLWSRLEELDVPLVLHEGTTQDVPQVASDRYENFLFRHMITHAFEQQMALLSLIAGGVLERHPGLRVLIVEAGVGWVPYWIERMDHHLKEWGHASIPLPLAPSEYYRRQCYVSADAEETLLPQVISAIGDENICFSTDYPHPDHDFEGIVAALASRTDIPEQSKRKILGGNAERLFGI